MPAERLSAVIPTWNRRELLERALDALSSQTLAAGEVIVVDNGSTDGAAELAESRGARVVRIGRNAGFAAAVNRGIAEARGEWIAVLNNDVEPAPDYFSLLVDAARQNEAWFATGRLVMTSAPDTLDGAFDVLCRGGCALRVANGRTYGAPLDRPQRIFSAPWTAAIFRAELFRRVGLLDERFGSYLEDVDFGARCARLSLGGLYVPEAVARHMGNATLGSWSREFVRHMSRNQVLIAARHLEIRDLWHIVAAQLLWGAAALGHGAAISWLGGKWDGVRGALAARRAFRRDGTKPFRIWMAENERLVRGEGSWYWRMYSLLTPGESK